MIKRILLGLVLLSSITFTMPKEYFGAVVDVIGKGMQKPFVYVVVLRPDKQMELIKLDNSINFIANDLPDDTKYHQLVGSKVYTIGTKKNIECIIELNIVSK